MREARDAPTLDEPDCLGSDTLLDVVEGRADAAMRTRVERHASRCADCREVLSSLARGVATTDSEGDDAAVIGPGARLGRFIVRERLGAGGMGVVYAAHDPELDRTVAIKVLRAEVREQPQLEERLRREAQAMAQIAHPNVVAVHDVGRHGERIFVAMEFVDGETLAHWCRARPQPVDELLARFVAAGRGLATIHAAGLIHRDFKPENVLVGKDGRVRVVDLGLARSTSTITDDDRTATELTAPGTALGTPRYMAPETRAGKEADARSDQYSFCVALDDALRGRRVPRRVRAAIARGLAEQPADRHLSMTALLAQIAPRRRAWKWVALGAVATVPLAAVAVVVAARAGSPPEPCRGAERHLAGVWDAKRKAAIADALRGTGAPFAAATVAELTRVVDGYTGRWIAMHTEACRATRVHREQTEDVLALRMGCLEERRRELAALGDRLLEVDREGAGRAVGAAHNLVDLAGCADVAALSAPVRPPGDPVTRARVEAVRSQLAIASSLRHAGRYREGAAATKQLVTRATELGYRPLEAEVRELDGILGEELGDFEAAERAFTAAVWTAEASRHDLVAARGLLALIDLTTERDARPDELAKLRSRVTAVLERLGRPAGLEADLHVAVGMAEIGAGRYTEAETELNAAIELIERGGIKDELRLVDPLTALGSIALIRARGADGERFFERALAIRRRVFGEDHPELAKLYDMLAAAQYSVNELDAAAANFERARAVYERAFGPVHYRVASVMHNQALIDTYRGREANAIELLRRAAEIDEQTLGAEHPSTADHLDALALTLEQIGKPDEALVVIERVLAIQRKHPSTMRLGESFHTLARIQLARRKLPEARAAAAEARRIIEPELGEDMDFTLLRTIGEIELELAEPAHGVEPLEKAVARMKPTVDPAQAAWTRGLLGRALYDAGSDRARGLTLVRAAHRVLAGDERATFERDQLERWMRARKLR